MASSPFAFFRGAAAVMAMDLAATPTSGLRVQVCGDAHLVNFGIYNSPERRLVFDLNDFDETLPGPWEWDVKRLAASLVIASQDNGFSDAETIDVVRDSMRAYRTSMASFAGMTNLEVWYSRLEVENLMALIQARAVEAKVKVPDERVKAMRRNVSKFATRDNLQAFTKLTEVLGPNPNYFTLSRWVAVPVLSTSGALTPGYS